MQLAPSLRKLADQFRRHVGDWIERNPEGAARIALWLEEEIGSAKEAGAPADLLRSFVEGLVPRNWWPLTIGIQGQARRVTAETGICLVWVPPADVIEAIVCAKSKEDRDKVLLENAVEILDAVDVALSEATHPQLEITVAGARAALAVQRAGFSGPAQSHTASVLGEVIEGHYGFDFRVARGAFKCEAATAPGLWSARRAAVEAAIRVAIVRSRHRPPGAGFSRHLSAHGVDPRQFREPHAIEGLMLLAGAIRELHEIYRVADRGFGPSPRLDQYAGEQLLRRIEQAGGRRELNGTAETAALS
ncbi:MAG: hypothetical protein AB7L18_13365 [Hyphomicrobiaceae bacterium]